MDKIIYRKHINNVGKYVEHVLLPELLSFVIVRMYTNYLYFNCSFKFYYNYYKRIFNVKNISYPIVYKITKNILLKRHGLLIINSKPLIVEKIKEP